MQMNVIRSFGLTVLMNLQWMYEWMNVWMNEWMNVSNESPMNEWMNEWMNLYEWMNVWMNECMNEWMYEWMHVTNLQWTPNTSQTTSPVRYKRVLSTTVTTHEPNPRPTKKKSSAPAVKSLNYESICEESRDKGIESLNNDCVLSALNNEELYNSEKETTQLKTVIVSPNGNVEIRLSFDESITKIIYN
jgi:hypothetical protein